MFIAHLPAGYLVTSLLTRRARMRRSERRRLIGLGLVSSIGPDLDLIYFYTLDARAVSHHSYWTHVPWVWIALGALVAAILWRSRLRWYCAACVSANGLMHLALDSVAGGIRWLHPLDMHYYRLTTVPARFDWWYANFILHWTFLLELAIVALAIAALRQSLQAGRRRVTAPV